MISLLPVLCVQNPIIYAVSYTHLDVYKRQITDSAGRRLRVEHDTRSGRIIEICGPHPEDPEKEITPVSYTHLDVYKRQHLWRYDDSRQLLAQTDPLGKDVYKRQDIAYPRKSLLLLLNFIEAITFFFQYQSERGGQSSPESPQSGFGAQYKTGSETALV